MIKTHFRAFSTAEIITTLGIIGVLCISMLALNSMTDNNYKVASTKLAQADSALKSWGKAISKSNETGQGAQTEITNQNSLNKSITEYLDSNVGITKDETISSENGVYKGGNGIALKNGVKLQLKYIDSATQNADNTTYKRTDDSILAVITASIDVKGKNTRLSEEYALKSSGVQSLASLYEGWEKLTYNEDKTNENNPNGDASPIRWYCNSDGTTCIPGDTNSDIGNIYRKTNNVTPCGAGQTGSVTTYTIGTLNGEYDRVTDTCCAAPLYYTGKTSPKCDCIKEKMTFTKGQIFVNDHKTCTAMVTKGAYAVNGEQKLCDYADKEQGTKASYCPEDGMDTSLICPKGFYCPNSKNTDDKTRSKYHDNKYIDTNNDKTIDKVEDGGLIDKVKCSAGSYCNADGGTTPTDVCPVGTYCPEGSINPTPCPAGKSTYKVNAEGKPVDNSGKVITDINKLVYLNAQVSAEACRPCPANTYTPVAGGKCLPCDTANGQWSNEGATSCSGCPAGEFFDLTQKKCTKCPAGTYQDTSGAVGTCKPCTGGQYQDEEGQTSCKNCPAHSKVKLNAENIPVYKDGITPIDKNAKYPDSKKFCLCDKGYGTDEKGSLQNDTVFCKLAESGYISNDEYDNVITGCPVGTYKAVKGVGSCLDCEKNTYQDKTAQAVCLNCPEKSETKEKKTTSVEQCFCIGGYAATDKEGAKLTSRSKCTITDNTHFSPQWDNTRHACRANSHTLNGEGTSDGNECLCDNAFYFDKDKPYAQQCQPVACATYSNGWAAENNPGQNMSSINGTVQYNSERWEEPHTYRECPALHYSKNATQLSDCKKLGTNQIFAENKCAAKACPEHSIPNNDQTECLCDPGYTLSGGKCVPCPCGQYKPEQGNMTCTKCPAGTYYSQKNLPNNPAKAEFDCLEPDPGYYVENGEGICEQKLICPNYGKLFLIEIDGNIRDSHRSSYGADFTIEYQLKSFGGGNVGNLNGWTYGSDAHNGQKSNDKRLQNLLNNMSQKDKQKNFTFYTSYLISEHGEIVGVFSRQSAENILQKTNNKPSNCSALCKQDADCIKSCQNIVVKSSPYAHTPGSGFGGYTEDYTGGSVEINGCPYEISDTIKRMMSPLVLDLKGNGLKFTSVEDGVLFDLTANGSLDQTAWTEVQTEFDDAFLIFDKNKNGQVDNGKELFGNQRGQETGFDELGTYDDKKITIKENEDGTKERIVEDGQDGLITKEDTIYSRLQLWVDFNKNAKVDYEADGTTKELKSLEEAGITELSTRHETEYDENGEVATDEHGNQIGFVGWFKMLTEKVVDGVKMFVETVKTMIDVFFQMF